MFEDLPRHVGWGLRSCGPPPVAGICDHHAMAGERALTVARWMRDRRVLSVLAGLSLASALLSTALTIAMLRGAEPPRALAIGGVSLILALPGVVCGLLVFAEAIAGSESDEVTDQSTRQARLFRFFVRRAGLAAGGGVDRFRRGRNRDRRRRPELDLRHSRWSVRAAPARRGASRGPGDLRSRAQPVPPNLSGNRRSGHGRRRGGLRGRCGVSPGDRSPRPGRPSRQARCGDSTSSEAGAPLVTP